MKKIVRFDSWSVMKIGALCYGAFGILEGIFIGLMFTFVPLSNNTGGHQSRVFGPMFGILALVFAPPIFAIFGGLMAGIGAAIYNLSARYVGGIEVEVS